MYDTVGQYHTLGQYRASRRQTGRASRGVLALPRHTVCVSGSAGAFAGQARESDDERLGRVCRNPHKSASVKRRSGRKRVCGHRESSSQAGYAPRERERTPIAICRASWEAG
eukprot:2643000-Rhodomonas_salina.2